MAALCARLFLPLLLYSVVEPSALNRVHRSALHRDVQCGLAVDHLQQCD